MAFHYNLQFKSADRHFSIFDLERQHVLAGSTCSALYHQKAVQTGTLVKILESTDCNLGDFLTYHRTKTKSNAADGSVSKQSIDLDDMVKRQVISRTARRYFLSGRPMSLNTLDMIAEDQGVNLLDFVKVEAEVVRDAHGNLKNSKKVLYLTEW